MQRNFFPMPPSSGIGERYICSMNSLDIELRRLYLLKDPNASAEAPWLMMVTGRVRALVLELSRPADWNATSSIWHRVQSELELPAPAIAVTGNDGYQLWFSLAEPVSTAQALIFLESLRKRYLAAVAPERFSLMPNARNMVQIAPALQATTGQWSAFVAPYLAAIFADSPGLDVCPSPEAQAKVLADLKCISPERFYEVLKHAEPRINRQPDKHPEVELPEPQQPSPIEKPQSTPLATSPKDFLLGVMNDPAASLNHRIEAAKALLPYSLIT